MDLVKNARDHDIEPVLFIGRLVHVVGWGSQAAGGGTNPASARVDNHMKIQAAIAREGREARAEQGPWTRQRTRTWARLPGAPGASSFPVLVRLVDSHEVQQAEEARLVLVNSVSQHLALPRTSEQPVGIVLDRTPG
ncbi:unnamed protein product [Prorocentrum cordatum]|uniref:Subtilisin n=1 Tax=Prorocentrum cordatum TaxID=2364126 RepID=A0ABN9VI50_9DINO|nr:unnamed protein product [Polarella glacialis]